MGNRCNIEKRRNGRSYKKPKSRFADLVNQSRLKAEVFDMRAEEDKVNKPYNLFIDDERTVEETYDEGHMWNEHEWVIARSTSEAIAIVKERGIPKHLALDFDLGFNDNILKFLKEFRKLTDVCPEWETHSSYFGAHESISSFIDDIF